ncbi:group I truncated hemoglobin [Kyrpidia tusciae]|uniref:Group 1 truncated hemoglobin n=1 Tax=Kyrpidia tusciae (strain DSM 2912 / NBRC 15312 / T2) TaxID=562970 RepID=D5WXG9_KYRT2|nr:group 1 truncated hemoglobin [Kyrpidia tusciae]ADG05890.1 globin [Kyrpidia tusciae DSM 2912]
MSTLYERLGGKEGIGKVVDTFYDKVLADPRVRHFFANTDMEKQRRHQTLFISFAAGGPEYTGRSMRKAHEGLGIQNEHFEAIVELLIDSLREHGVVEADIDTVAQKLAPLRSDIVERGRSALNEVSRPF